MIERPSRSSSFARAKTDNAPSPLITFSREARGRIRSLYPRFFTAAAARFLQSSAALDNRRATTPVAPTTHNHRRFAHWLVAWQAGGATGVVARRTML